MEGFRGFPFGQFQNFGGFFNPMEINQNFNFPNQTSPPAQAKPPTPCASTKAITSIPKVKVTTDDIQEASNKECMICLSEHEVGETVSKLPCGHIYHPQCIEEWLRRKCTCPTCSYELETDDKEYEKERRQKMRARKPRYRRDELEKKSVGQLREILNGFGISTNGCFDKREIVDRLIASDKISLVEGVPPVMITSNDLKNSSVQNLRHMLVSFGLNPSGAIEKNELIQRLLDSGRVVIHDETIITNHEDVNEHENRSFFESESSYSNNSYSADSPTKQKTSQSNKIEINENSLKTMPIRELKAMMSMLGISLSGCVEREDIVNRITTSKDVRIVTTGSS